MARQLNSLTMLVVVAVVVVVMVTDLTSALYTGDYVSLGQKCDPGNQNGGIANSREWSGKICFPGSKCDEQLKICDCSDSPDGKWKRTFESGECRLLPGSVCRPRVDQDYYRCVNNSKCMVTRVGEDESLCPADAPCDSGDAECVCEPGKSCLTTKVKATPSV